MTIFGELNIVQLSTFLGAVAAVVGSYVVLRKFRPERDALYISNVQGATTVLNGLVETLNRELQRKEAIIDDQGHQIQVANNRIRSLEQRLAQWESGPSAPVGDGADLP